jgi:hypothetical protein
MADYILKMGASNSPETLLPIYLTTLYHTKDGSNLHTGVRTQISQRLISSGVCFIGPAFTRTGCEAVGS